MSKGKLYRSGEKKLAVDIEYKLNDDSAANWWGDFILTEYKPISDGGRYIIEFEDGRKGMCSIRKDIHRATTGIPTRYRYSFRGSGLLK